MKEADKVNRKNIQTANTHIYFFEFFFILMMHIIFSSKSMLNSDIDDTDEQQQSFRILIFMIPMKNTLFDDTDEN